MKAIFILVLICCVHFACANSPATCTTENCHKAVEKCLCLLHSTADIQKFVCCLYEEDAGEYSCSAEKIVKSCIPPCGCIKKAYPCIVEKICCTPCGCDIDYCVNAFQCDLHELVDDLIQDYCDEAECIDDKKNDPKCGKKGPPPKKSPPKKFSKKMKPLDYIAKTLARW